ncbi:hypothetical protein N6L27_23095 [Leisingera sp. SS27]|uniref:hypothetical protein n=1 Tax=Leisingera sp. SS27 TaxID=2979462 RepID=UPI00232F1928|nr:hypothetical protein [Leisingera sp. SS27]MDC0660902.1 hypothetical protein [Leisingera sp. SS27]
MMEAVLIRQRSLPRGLRRASLLPALLVAVLTPELWLALIIGNVVLVAVYGIIYGIHRRGDPFSSIRTGSRLFSKAKENLEQVSDPAVSWFLVQSELRHIARDVCLLPTLVTAISISAHGTVSQVVLPVLVLLILAVLVLRALEFGISRMEASQLPRDIEVLRKVLEKDFPDWI